MKDEVNDIQDIFKNGLESAKVEKEDSGWDGIEKKLGTIPPDNNFNPAKGFKPLSFITVSVVICLAVYYMLNQDSLFTENKEYNISVPVYTEPDQVDSIKTKSHLKTTPAIAAEKNRGKQYPVIYIPESENKKSSLSADSIRINDEIINPNSDIREGNLIYPDPAKIHSEEIKKTVYITRQDTLIVTDTLDQSALKKKNRKNKR